MTDDDLDREFTSAELFEMAEDTRFVEIDGINNLVFTEESAELPPIPDGEAMVVRALRVPIGLETRAKEIAAARGMAVTALMRQFITEGVTAAEDAAGIERDVATEIRAIADSAERAIRLLTTAAARRADGANQDEVAAFSDAA